MYNGNILFFCTDYLFHYLIQCNVQVIKKVQLTPINNMQ